MTQTIREIRPDARARRGLPLNLHEGWVAGILLAALLISVTLSVVAANWTDGLEQTTWAALGGLLFGALVARVRVNGLLAFVLATIVGAAFVMWLLKGYVSAPPDAQWNEYVILIQDRLDQWLVRVFAGGLGADWFPFLSIMCAVSWYMGYLGAWFVFRHHQPWGAILPAGAALLINTFYAAPQSGLFLMFFLLASLLLLVRTTLLKRQATWATYAIRFANDIGLDFLVYGVIFSALIILLAWLIPPTMPGPAWFAFITDRARAPWQDFQDTMTRSFSALRGNNNAAPTTYFGNSAAMGGPIQLGNREVFQVNADAGQYWRAVVFDTYDGNGWTSGADQTVDLEAADPRWKTMPMEQRRVVTQTVEVRLPTDNLVIAASQPLRVNQPVNAKFLVGRTDNGQTFLDMQALRLRNPLELGDQYVVSSSLSGADEASLRGASETYPLFIRRTYMDVPTTVPARVRELTRQITADATNNYDKARAIETYLREHIAYSLDVEPIPPGVDGVDYLLFERPEGYCNYYASAMAVMARLAGIPARVASGYAVASPGDDGLFHINESNAHTWPELYFAELGWVEFEPTAARQVIVRPQPKSAQERADNTDPFSEEDALAERLGDRRAKGVGNQLNPPSATDFSLPRLLGPNFGWSAAMVLIGLGVALAMTIVHWRWQKHLQPLKPAARALAEMYRFVRFIGWDERVEATPDERAHALATRMPDARADIAQVNALYVRERYGDYALSPQESAHAQKIGVAIQKQMWRAMYQQRIGQRLAAWQARIKGKVQV
ncbi:hypothetical protein FBQ82_14190 [Anaerolineae bacterium CFX7]|nr:hypothetical protein [Anaerolineae bacterium CFX7]